MQPQLPLEVLDHILSFLRDDRPSLQCCAKVNQAFSDMVERHWYHSVMFSNFEPRNISGKRESEELAKLFIKTPRLRFHVRVLRIAIASREDLRWFVKPITNEERIAEVLPLIPQITTILLSGKMSWKKLHQVFRNSFVQMLVQTPSVENISIDGIDDFLLSLLNPCQSLKHLSLINIDGSLSIAEDSPSRFVSNNERARPISLRVEHCQLALPTILSWLRSPYSPQIQHLSCLRVSVPQIEDIHHLQALLEDCSSQLKELYLHANEIVRTTYNTANEIVYPPEDAPHQVLNLSGFPSLKSLSMSGGIQATDAYWNSLSTNSQGQSEHHVLDTCVPWFIQLLQTICSPDTPSNLEQIVFEITFHVDRNTFAKFDWQPLAEILTSESFASLRRVDLHVQCIREFATLISMLHSDVHLSSLVQSDLLSISGPLRRGR